MSGLALLLDSMGHIVSGCDADETFYLNRVRERGIHVGLGHHRGHIDTFEPDMIVHSSAIPQDHPEIIEAKRRGIRVARRAEVLSIIFNRDRGIGVAGTHGKTTTSSMIAMIAERSGLAPTVAIGGELPDIGCNAMLGDGACMVAELDESDGSFELFEPDVCVVTNIDWDHIDHYPTFDDVVDAFGRFIKGRKPGAPLVICAEDTGTQQLLSTGRYKDAVTYGWGTGWTWGAADVEFLSGGGVSYTAYHDGEARGRVTLKLSGEHNVLNSLAAIAASGYVGVSFEDAVSALSEFGGAKRRMQRVGECGGIIVYDDYGHHPREIAATLTALSKAFPSRSMHVIFQPHRYSRTQALYADFARSLAARSSDRVYLLPIYAANEAAIAGVSSFLIADEIVARGGNVQVCGDFQEAVDTVCESASRDDLIVTIGAGDIEYLGKQILAKLQKHTAQEDRSDLAS